VTVQDAHRHAIEVLSSRLPHLGRAEIHSRTRLLLDWIAGVSHAHLLAPARVLSADEQVCFASALEDAARGRPLPYITGTREFFGLHFFVDERVLIPRPETELLVETVTNQFNDQERMLLADLGTGSGCITISLAHALPQARVFATDASAGALEVAQQNARQNGVTEQVQFVTGTIGNWAAPLRHLAGQFDAIASNPPYISHDDVQQLQPEIRNFEPHSALEAGEDGLDCYRQLATQVKVLLKPSGFFAAELGMGQFEAVRAIFVTEDWHVERPRVDFAGIERVLIARKT
jgi:release factor glutamine methyltransferase